MNQSAQKNCPAQKPRTRPTANEKLLKEAYDAMTDAINDWQTPDSPEAFCFSMGCVVGVRDRIAARLGISE